MKWSWRSITLKITSWNGDHLEGAAALGSRLKELSSACRQPPALARGGGVRLVSTFPTFHCTAAECCAATLHSTGVQGCKSSILIYCDNAGKAKSAQLSDSLVIKLVSNINHTARAPG